MSINPYLEVRMKHIKGQLSPALFEWIPILQEEVTAKQIKQTFKESLGNPVASYTINYPNHITQKCYLFTKKNPDGRDKDKHTMLEYTKQKKQELNSL